MMFDLRQAIEDLLPYGDLSRFKKEVWLQCNLVLYRVRQSRELDLLEIPAFAAAVARGWKKNVEFREVGPIFLRMFEQAIRSEFWEHFNAFHDFFLACQTEGWESAKYQLLD